MGNDDKGQQDKSGSDDKDGKKADAVIGNDGKGDAGKDGGKDGAADKSGDAGKDGKDGKGADDKSGDKGDGKQDGGSGPVVPDKYDLTKRSSFEVLDDAEVESLTASAKALGLTQEQFDKRLAEDAARFTTLRDSLAERLKNDKELGGKNLDQTLVDADKGLAMLMKGRPEAEQKEFVSLLRRGNLQMHPMVAHIFKRAAQLAKEDQVDGGGKGGGKAADESLEDSLYPTTKGR